MQNAVKFGISRDAKDNRSIDEILADPSISSKRIEQAKEEVYAEFDNFNNS